ncbi:MAG: Ig-like domain-containing protein [Clostridia bacterium]
MVKKGIALFCVLSLVFTHGIFLNVNAGRDKTAPVYKSASPRNNQENIERNTKISINFNENIYNGKNFTGIKIKNLFSQKCISISRSISKKQILIKHTYFLTYDTIYVLTIPANAVKDKAGNLLKKAKTISFRIKANPNEEPNDPKKAACQANLRTMDGTIQLAVSMGDTITSIADLVPMYLTRVPACPDGGTYTFVPAFVNQAAQVVCSIPSHNLY